MNSGSAANGAGIARRLLPLLASVLAIAAAGCDMAGPKLGDYGVRGGATELSGGAAMTDDSYQCGPAALHSAAAAQGIPVKLAELDRVFAATPEDGPLTDEMSAAAIDAGVIPYMMHSSHLDLDLVHEVQAGNPVIVLLNRGFSFAARWRFAVVAGVDPAGSTLTLRSCSNPRETMTFGAFLGNWKDGEYWAMVIPRPDRLPASFDGPAVVAAVSRVEAKHPESAARAYAVVTQRWPDNAAAWEKLANARHAQNDLRGTTEALQTSLRLAPGNTVARNNLAYVLLERNCADEAETQINLAIGGETDPKKLQIFQQTRRKIMKHDGPSVVCSGL